VGIVFMGDPATPRFWMGGLMVFGSVVALNRLKANGRQISGSAGNKQK